MEQNIKQLSFTYVLKDGTKTSYYLQEGAFGYLPERICIGSFKEIRGGRIRVGELKATYKKSEGGKYKHFTSTNSIHTSIWQTTQSGFFGYGVLDERYFVYDLLVFEKPDTKTIKIYLLENEARPEKISKAISSIKKSKDN